MHHCINLSTGKLEYKGEEVSAIYSTSLLGSLAVDFPAPPA